MGLAPDSVQARTGQGQGAAPACQGIARSRVLGHRCEGQNFGQAEFGGLLVEPDARRRAHAFHIGAVGRKIEVGFENFILAVMPFQHQSLPDLAQFAGNAGRGELPGQAHHLHADGGAAHAAAPESHLGHGTQQGQRIDAGVAIKGTVLVEQGGFHEFRGHGRQGRENTVCAVRGQGNAQHAVPAVQKNAREARLAVKVGPGRGMQRQHKGQRRAAERKREADKDQPPARTPFTPQ